MRRRGLTLLELVVVLAILAVLTTLAVKLTDSLLDQTQFETTQRTLDSIQSAVLGPRDQVETDGSRAVSGFVADTGRLPLAVGDDPATQLAELWANPRGLPAFGLAVAAADADIKLLTGWRGPYLRLPPQPGPLPRLL